MEEIFKTVEGFEDYQVSNLGRVISNKNGKSVFLKPQKDAIGYYHVRLYPEDAILGSYGPGRGKRPQLYKVHRLVAETFIPKGDTGEDLTVNHLDGDKSNNCADNLEWVTLADNIQHSWDSGLRDNSARKAAKKKYRPVKLIYPDGTEEYFQSQIHAALAFDIRSQFIAYSVRRTTPHTKGKFKGYRFVKLNELPPGETFKAILGIEEKMLKYYDTLAKEYTEKAREYRAKKKSKV